MKKNHIANRKRKSHENEIKVDKDVERSDSKNDLVKESLKCKQTPNDIPNNDGVDEITEHQRQLDTLKKSDPDFYNFLKEQDATLLDFQHGSDSTEDDNDLPTDDQLLEADFTSDVEYDHDTSNDDNSENTNKPHKTVEIFNETIDRLIENSHKKSIPSIKLLFKYFHSIIYDQFNENLSEPSVQSILNHKEHHIYHKYRINAVYSNKILINKIINFVLKQLPSILISIFDDRTTTKKLNSLKLSLKIYFIDQFVMLNFVYNSTESLISVINSIKVTNDLLRRYPKILHAYIKLFVKMLENSDEDVRISCFNLLRKWTQTKSSTSIYRYIEKAFLSNNGFSKYHDINDGLWLFLKVSICELLTVIPQNAYQILFKLCKRIILDLQNAIVNNDKKSTVKIYSWQFLHSIELVTFAICNESNSILSTNLLHPITQIMLATLNLTTSNKFVPFKLHILNCLVKLVIDTDVYIPLGIHFIKILQHKEFLVVGANVIGPNVKEPIIDRMIKVSKEQAVLNQYKVIIFNTTIELLLKFVGALSNNVAFPDFAFLPIKWLRMIIKENRVKRQSVILKMIVQKIEEYSRKISDIRFTLEDGPSIFHPLKSDDTLTTLNNISTIKLPSDQNCIINYLNSLKEKNFDEPIAVRTHKSDSPLPRSINKNKLKDTLKRFPTKLKSVSTHFNNNNDLEDQLIDLDLSDT